MAKVFISYSGADVEIARHVASCLRTAKIDVWLDEERLSGGNVLLPALRQAAFDAECGVFLISPAWTSSGYTNREMEFFEERDRMGTTVRRIGVMLAPRDQVPLRPAGLALLKTIDWVQGRDDPAESFYQLYCSVQNTEPGPRKEWRAKAEALLEGSISDPVPVTDSRSTVHLPGQNRWSLLCDRGEEWTQIQSIYLQPRHQLVLITGPRGEAHDYFLVRIEEFLLDQPPYRIEHLHWTYWPASESEYLEALADALGCRAEDLPRVFPEIMRARNLILVHPTAASGSDRDLLENCFLRWLPDLLARTKPAMRLTCIQAVEWDAPEGIGATLLGLFGAADDGESTVAELIAAMKRRDESRPHPVTPAQVVKLRRVELDDVKDFCETNQLTDREQEELLARTRRARTSRAVFDEIDRYMRARAARV